MTVRSPAPTPDDALRQSGLLGRLVLNKDTAEELGHITEFWFNPTDHQVMGLTCRAGLLNRQKQFIPWTQIDNIGRDSIMVRLSGDESADPPDTAMALTQQMVWTDNGDSVGLLTDYLINPERGDILSYLFVTKGLQGMVDGAYALPRDGVVSMNEKRLIARQAAVETADRASEGLGQKMLQVADFLKEDYTQTRSDLASMFKGTQAIATQLQQTTQKLVSRDGGDDEHRDDASPPDAAPEDSGSEPGNALPPSDAYALPASTSPPAPTDASPDPLTVESESTEESAGDRPQNPAQNP